jgi:CDP-6-deoxy-D-xylo-4-hexulose-3-dehydrase
MEVADVSVTTVTATEEELLHVPYGCTVHGEAEIAAVVSVLRTSTQMGKHVRAMEEQVAALFDKHYGVMLNSGSSANYLAVEILNLPAGSEVITPALTFSTTVAPLVKHGLVPAFVDVEADTFNLDADRVEAMITPATKAMMVPNLLGNLPDWQKLRALADEYQLLLIEDSADTLGATVASLPVGRNGGMLCVNSAALVEKAKLLRSWGRSSSLYVESEAIENRFNIAVDNIPYDAKFVFETIGYNLEPSEMGAAFGLVQLEKLEANIRSREQHFQQQYDFFKQYEDWFMLPKQLPESRTGWLAFPLVVRDSAPFTRTAMQIFLEKRRIQTRTIFTGNILRQPGFTKIRRKESKAGYPAADQVMRGGILLACHHGLSARQLQYVHDTFTLFARQYR